MFTGGALLFGRGPHRERDGFLSRNRRGLTRPALAPDLHGVLRPLLDHRSAPTLWWSTRDVDATTILTAWTSNFYDSQLVRRANMAPRSCGGRSADTRVFFCIADDVLRNDDDGLIVRHVRWVNTISFEPFIHSHAAILSALDSSAALSLQLVYLVHSGIPRGLRCKGAA